MPPKKSAIAAAASKTGKKKKWSKGKVKDKAQNAVYLDKVLYERVIKEVPTFKMITPSVLIDRLKINGSLARLAIRHFEREGQIKPVIHHNGQLGVRRQRELRGHAGFGHFEIAGAAEHAPGKHVGLAGGCRGHAAQPERLGLGQLVLCGHSIGAHEHLHLRLLEHPAEAGSAVVAPRERRAVCRRVAWVRLALQERHPAPRANAQLNE